MGEIDGERFRPSQRLLTAGDYRHVFGAPDHKSGQQELLLLARRNNFPRHRLGLAIAKKHIPTAVKRNEMKRLAREAFRKIKLQKPTLDIVVLSRPAAAVAPKPELRRALDTQFRRLLARSQQS